MAGRLDSNETRANSRFSAGRWARACAIGLGSTYGLFAALGDTAEFALDAGHDGLLRHIALLLAVTIGTTLFVLLRRRLLVGLIEEAARTALASGLGLAIGLVAGFVVGGPPFDFILGAFGLGSIGGALQWRTLRRQVSRPGRLLFLTIVAWLAAAVSVGLVAVLAGDVLHELFGSPADGTLMGSVFFTFILTLLGVVGGLVGGLIEGSALSRRLDVTS